MFSKETLKSKTFWTALATAAGSIVAVVAGEITLPAGLLAAGGSLIAAFLREGVSKATVSPTNGLGLVQRLTEILTTKTFSIENLTQKATTRQALLSLAITEILPQILHEFASPDDLDQFIRRTLADVSPVMREKMGAKEWETIESQIETYLTQAVISVRETLSADDNAPGDIVNPTPGPGDIVNPTPGSGTIDALRAAGRIQ